VSEHCLGWRFTSDHGLLVFAFNNSVVDRHMIIISLWIWECELDMHVFDLTATACA
jgi:hypothetical protein